MDSKAIRNYILLVTVKQMGLPYRQKEHLYLLIIILEDLITYRGGIINLKTGLIWLTIKGRRINISFNILLLGRNKVILRMP